MVIVITNLLNHYQMGKSIDYVAIFLIFLSNVAIDIGIFSNFMPTIIIRTGCYILLGFRYRNELKKIFNNNRYLLYFSLTTFLLLVWGLFLSKKMEEYAVCIEHFFLVLMPVWIILMRQSINRRYLLFIIIIDFSLGLSKYFGEHSMGMGNYGGYTSILYFYIILFPYLSLLWKICMLLFWIMSFCYDVTDRTHMLMMVGCLMISLMQYYNIMKFNCKIWNFVHRTFIAIPFFVIVLSTLDIFNVFSYSESKTFEGMQGDEQANVDTRTGLYKEVIDSQDGVMDWLIGKSYIGTYKSSLDIVYGYSNYRRMGCEVGILEVLIRGGLLYIFIISILFYSISRKALLKSSNKFCKALGMFVLLYWLTFFIELQMDAGIWNIALWLAFGVIMNPKVRQMTDNEIKKYFHNIIGTI